RKSGARRKSRSSPTRTTSGTGRESRSTFRRGCGGCATIPPLSPSGEPMEIYNDILETLGNTPLVKLGRFHPGPSTLAAKIEYFNPGGSVKDRIGIAMIEAGERSGQLKPGGTIVEPTSGNTGVGLAMAANLRGYKLICTSADKIPKEKVALLEAMGATVITCPTSVAADDPRSYYKVAERIRDE